MDGVFARHGADVRFCPAPLLTAADVADVLATIVPRVRRLLERRGPQGLAAAGPFTLRDRIEGVLPHGSSQRRGRCVLRISPA